jgi:hypothetical protein
MLEHKTDEIVIDSKGFWQWCIKLKIIDFWTLSTVQYSKKVDNTSWLRLCLSKGPKRVGISPPAHLRIETDPISKTLCFLVLLEFQAMNKVQKPSNSDQILFVVFCCLHFWFIYLFSLVLLVSAAFVWQRRSTDGTTAWPSHCSLQGYDTVL